jgi:hypothetical protein
MPTKKPRVFLTLDAEDEDALAVLTAKWGLSKPDVLRKALRQAAKEKPHG